MRGAVAVVLLTASVASERAALGASGAELLLWAKAGTENVTAATINNRTSVLFIMLL